MKPAVTPPAGYRMLREGEYLRNGDIYTRTQGVSWHETRSRGKYTERGYWPMARRDAQGPGVVKP